jgi:outer membrane protein assembly factor BamE (lipoprotein component of BamABCDE complex)
MQPTKLILLTILAYTLGGCANILPVYHPKISQGNPQIHKNHDKIKKGMARQTVESLIGQPTLTSLYADKNRVIYAHQTAENQRVISESLIIQYNTQNKVASLRYNPPKTYTATNY